MRPPSSSADGVCFPVTEGSRSTTDTGRAIFADAARVADANLAERIDSTRNWRSDYVPLVRELTEAYALTPQSSRAISEAGLASMRGRMVFARAGQTVGLEQALSSNGGGSATVQRTEACGGRPTSRAPCSASLLSPDCTGV